MCPFSKHWKTPKIQRSAIAADNGRARTDEQDSSNGSPAVYDYIVVGSGPGGSPLAARLALAGEKVPSLSSSAPMRHRSFA